MFFALMLTGFCATSNMAQLLSQLSLGPITAGEYVNQTKQNLTVHVIVNYGGFILPMGALAVEGTRLAVEAASKRLAISRNYEISFELHDDMCIPAVDVALAVEFLESTRQEAMIGNTVPLLVGPLCMANSIVGRLVKHYNVVGMIEASSNLAVFRDRRAYESFFSLRPSFESFFEAIPAFIENNGWKRVFLVSETLRFWSPLEEILLSELTRRNITVAGTTKVMLPPDPIPEPTSFDVALKELSEMPDPRIIILNTNTFAQLPCHLYRINFHGPQYVFIFPMFNAFLPNTFFRSSPDCTDEMLLEMLRSTIFYAFAEPINMYEEITDEVGNNKSAFEKELQQRLRGHPETEENWAFWRGAFYNQAMSTMVALDKVETKLKSANDSLLNWVTEGDRFQKNGSFISSQFRTTLEQLAVKGMTINEDEPPNSLKARTVFFQVQLTVSDDELRTIPREKLSSIVKFVPVATYNSAKSNPVIQRGPGKLVWRGPNKDEAPLDAIRVLQMKDDLVSRAVVIVLNGFATLLLLTNVGFLFAIYYTGRSRLTSPSPQPWFHYLIIIGNILVTLGIFVLPWAGNFSSHIGCMASSCLILLGIQLVTSTITTKMEVARLLAKWMPSQSGRLGRPIDRNRKRGDKLKFLSIKIAPPLIAIAIAIQTILVTLWFILEPFKTIWYDRGIAKSPHNISLAYQHYTLSCSNVATGQVSIGFIAAIVVCYIGVMLRSLYLSVALRRVSIKEIKDLHQFRIVSACQSILAVAGGSVIGAFFKDSDPATLEPAIALLALVAVAVNVGVIFVWKLPQVWQHLSTIRLVISSPTPKTPNPISL